MRLAIGIIASASYKPENEFLFGRPDQAPEGLMALAAHVQTGAINASLPDGRKITDCRTILSRKFPTDVARNEVCRDALKHGADYLLFLDADNVHPVSMVAALLNHDKPVITARYHLKKAPFSAVAYVKHRTQTGRHRYSTVHFGQGVFEIERAGAGALLIRSDVLKAIQDRQQTRWQQTIEACASLPEDAKNLLDVPPEPICQWFRYQRGPESPHDMTVSEDFWFFQQAREAGFSCWIDWDIDVPHVGSMSVDQSWNRPFLHTQVAEYENPDTRDLVLQNTIVRGYPEGMVLGDSHHIPEYQVTEGER